ncbi:vitamin B12 ABC transporter permease BtuC [Thaumasiovibrio subtropicus]|uniref:vitamin B12 ABC transporter permease BtuC n=1 Tax=Thaumasiovibrio subtropicus TaxID=1891207 RepID=UPI000B350F10|nr:vitamin B12 ABC transporter permease BtuC [Thaumasiovibrio subtropicus]
MDLLGLEQRQSRRWSRLLAVLFVLLFLSVLFSLSAGEVWFLPLGELSKFEHMLLWELRLPRALSTVAIGAMLAASGVSLQVVLGNPLAEPGILGVSGGASLFVILLLFLFPSVAHPYVLMAVAVIGALLFTLLLVGLSLWRRLSTPNMLLIGIALGILSSSVVTWVFYFSNDMNLRQLLYWLMGSVSGVTWQQLSILIFLVPILVWLCMQGKVLDFLMLGDVTAAQLGIDTHRTRIKLIGVIALLVGGSVALAGVIGFIGLVVPHILRLSFGPSHRFLVIASAVAGAGLLTLSDTLSRILMSSTELPVGVITASIGAPVFVWLLLRGEADVSR